MTTLFFPESYFVGIQPRIEGEGHNVPLGFAVPDGTDSAARKRKESVDRWLNKSGKYVEVIKDPTQKYGWRHEERPMPQPTTKTFKNEPMTGFKIVNEVRRYGYFGSGNVVWRIEDPRGFEMEISSSNLGILLLDGTIDHGEIKSPCLYAREGSKNALISVDSKEYIEVLEQTQKRKVAASTKMSDVPVGHKVSMLIQGGLTDLWYLGKVWIGFEVLDWSQWRNYRYDAYGVTGILGTRFDNPAALPLRHRRMAERYMFLDKLPDDANDPIQWYHHNVILINSPKIISSTDERCPYTADDVRTDIPKFCGKEWVKDYLNNRTNEVITPGHWRYGTPEFTVSLSTLMKGAAKIPSNTNWELGEMKIFTNEAEANNYLKV